MRPQQFVRHFINLSKPALTTLLLSVVLLLSGSSKAFSEEPRTFANFESGYGDWQVSGEAFGTEPAAGTLPDQMPVSGFEGDRLVNSYYGGDRSTGRMKSKPFEIDQPHLSFLIGGGNQPDKLGIRLLVDDKTVRSATGRDSEKLEWKTWNVEEFRGQSARLVIDDQATGGWGHICVDQIELSHRPRKLPELRLSEYRRSPDYYREPFRPQIHFSPEMNWMNDPNGLIYHKGEYHLFYQHNPHGNSWGHMSWGHAVSRDLVHWTHLPIALHEEYGIMIFSGCCVFDEHNTSGLGTKENPPLIAIYTGHGYGEQTQDIACSTDRGRHWTKYRGNPVLDIDARDFRDPRVFWHEPTERWIMLVSLATKRKIRFYSSDNLRNWNLLSEFGPAGTEQAANWECPDLFKLPVENESGREKWVLEVDMGNGSVAGGSGGEYFVGHFDGTEFHNETPAEVNTWVDYGRDFYAPISWANFPESDNRRVWIGWMNNWETCLVPTSRWRSAMSIPRRLTLRKIDGQYRMIQHPVDELKKLRQSPVVLNDLELTLENEVLISAHKTSTPSELEVTFQCDEAESFGISLSTNNGEETIIGYQAGKQQLYLDRTNSGRTDFHPAFAGRHVAPLKPVEGKIHLRLFIDASSVEVFANNGARVITDRIFPEGSETTVSLFSRGGTARVEQCTFWPLKSIWKQPTDSKP